MNLAEAIKQSGELIDTSIRMGQPCAFEVVKTREGFKVQPFGLHVGFKTQKLYHVSQIPMNHRAAI